MESKRHSRELEKDLARDLHKAEWTVKEQKLEDDIKTLREKLLLLVSLWIPSRCSFRPRLCRRTRSRNASLPASRIERGLLLTTGATPCWSRQRWIRR